MVHGFLRIDDFPYTAQMFLKYGEFRDAWMERRLRKVMNACVRSGVVPEMMVSSHAVLHDGSLVAFDQTMPQTVAALRQYSESGHLNINAHGMVHLHQKLYRDTGALDAREFLALDEDETRRHLEANIRFIREVFGKEAVGFVAPAWGYNDAVTKRVASDYFKYIADSFPRWKSGSCLDFGNVDPQYGFVHFPETLQYGKRSVERSEPSFWLAAGDQNGNAHLLYHGYRIPGEWRRIYRDRSMRTAIRVLLRGHLGGVLRASQVAGVKWGLLEHEAQRILAGQGVSQ